MRVVISVTACKCIVCGSLLLEMTNKRVGRQEGGEAGSLLKVYSQQLSAIVTHRDVRLVSRITLPLLEIFQPLAQASARTVQCLGMYETDGESGKYWYCIML